MTTIHIADDWLQAVRASLGGRADLVVRFRAKAGHYERSDCRRGRATLAI